MEQYCLFFDNVIIELEQQFRWRTATEYIYQKWKKKQNNFNALLCAGTQLWYTILVQSYYEDMPRNAINYVENIEWASESLLQDRLMEITRYGFLHLKSSAVFNAYFGYMIKVMPYLFVDYNGDYAGWQNKGKHMIYRAYEIEPENPFVKAMYYETKPLEDQHSYYTACKELWEVTPLNMWGNSEVNQYFGRILRPGDLYSISQES